MPKVILSVSNDLVSDQRVHRIACALLEMGYEVEAVGRQRRDSQPIQRRSYQITRLKLLFERKAFFYAELNLRLFFYLLLSRADVFTANDLDTLPANWLAATLRGKRLIYDTHEYFTEVPELVNRPRVRRAWLAIERFLFPKLKHISTVNSKIAEIYAEKYGKPVQVVMNLPNRLLLPDEKVEKKPIILYQGAVNLGRGVELMIEALRFCPPETQLWVAGGGDRLEAVKSLVVQLGLTERVKFFGLVPFERLSEITRQAKIGLSLEEDLGLNYRFATPNKVFDYVQCHLPVVVADLPLMREIVEKHEIGLVLTERTPQTLAILIQKLLSDVDLYARFAQNAAKAAEILCWENEKGALKRLYQE